MLLRIVRGFVGAGREPDFAAVCHRQVAGGARSPGLLGFFAGYRRSNGHERFVLVSTWQTQNEVDRRNGSSERQYASDRLSGIADIGSIETYELIGPIFRGIVDAPGGILRIASATVREARRDRMLDWLAGKERALRRQHLLLGWAFGEQCDGDERQVVSVTAWPSPLVIEAFVEPDRRSATESLVAAADEFVVDTAVEQYRALPIELPDVDSRRVVAARFSRPESAARAAQELGLIDSARDSDICVAPLGVAATDGAAQSLVLVARVAMADYACAERVIEDLGGDVIHTQPEVDPVAQREAPQAEDGGGLSAAFSPA